MAMIERSRIARRHKAGSVGNLLGCRAPAYARDHRRENVRAIRELERQQRQKRAQSEASAGIAAFKLRQFQDVPSRVNRPQQIGEPLGSRCCPPHAGSPAGVAQSQRRPHSAGAVASDTAGASPWARAPARGLSPPRWQGSRGCRPSSSPGKPGSAPATDTSFVDDEEEDEDGLDPVCKFEQAVEASRRRRLQCSPGSGAAPELDGPPAWWPTGGPSDEGPVGYRAMPEEERLEALGGLQSKLAELERKYQGLPLRLETEGHRKQQEALRARIAEAEAAVRLLSRPGVFVEM